MKKAISILLAILMVISLVSLAACGEKTNQEQVEQTENTSDVETTEEESEEITPEMLKNSLPKEYVPEKIAAGEEVVIGYSLNNFNGIGGAVNARLEEELPKMGLTLSVALDEGNSTTQIQNIENFITMKTALILIQTTDISLLQDIIEEAESAGICCVLYGDVPKFEMSAYTSTDLEAMGYAAGLLVRQWIYINHPDAGEGEIKTAVHGFYQVMPTTIVSDMILKAIEDDPRCDIVYTEDNVSGIESGFTFAENAYTVDSDVRVFVGYNLLGSYGCDQFVMSIPDVDPSEFCVVGTMYDSDVEKVIALQKEGESAWIGTVAGETDPAWGHLECIKQLLFEGVEGPIGLMQEIRTFGAEGYDVSEYLQEYYYNTSEA